MARSAAGSTTCWKGDELAPLQKALRARFKFMGPEIARMWLMASGRIKDE